MGRKELTFMEAVEEAKKGNKPYRAKTFYMGIDEGNDICFYKWNTVIPSDFPKVNILDLNSKWYIDEPEKTLYKILRSQSNEQIPLTENMKHDYKRIIDRGEQAIINALRAEHDIGMQRATYYFKEHLKKFIEFFGNDDIYNAEINIIKGEAKKIFGEELL